MSRDEIAIIIAIRLQDAPVKPGTFSWDDVSGWTREVAEGAADDILRQWPR